MVTRLSLVVIGSLHLLACSGAPDDRPPPAPQGGEAHAPGELAVGSSRPAAEKPVNAELALAMVPVVPDFLGTLSAAVTNAAGVVVTGSFEEVSTLAAAGTHELSFVLPAGERYSVSLLAVTSNADPTTCRASIDDFSLEEGVAARAQVLGWDCDAKADSVPVIANEACARLLDWSFVGRTMAELGQPVALAVSPRKAEGAVTRVAWSVPEVAFGEFSEPSSPRTEFHCSKAVGEVPLELRLSEGACVQTVTQTIACR